MARSLRSAKKTRDLMICSTTTSSFGQELSGDARNRLTAQGFAPKKRQISWGVVSLEEKKAFTSSMLAGRFSGAMIPATEATDGSTAGDSEERHRSTQVSRLVSLPSRDSLFCAVRIAILSPTDATFASLCFSASRVLGQSAAIVCNDLMWLKTRAHSALIVDACDGVSV